MEVGEILFLSPCQLRMVSHSHHQSVHDKHAATVGKARLMRIMEQMFPFPGGRHVA